MVAVRGAFATVICHTTSKRAQWQNVGTLLLGHGDVSTTMNYTHVLKVAAGGMASPLDALGSMVP